MKKKNVGKFIGCRRKKRFRTILADPPWQFENRTGKMAPEHKRLARYSTMTLDEILALPVSENFDQPAQRICE